MKSKRSEHHFIVYSLGRKWKGSAEVIKDYMKSFRSCPDWEAVKLDLEKLADLKDNSYDGLLTTWDGKGPTPDWLWRDFAAVRVIYVSLATKKG